MYGYTDFSHFEKWSATQWMKRGEDYLALKEKIRERLGRSPDVGESIMLANWEPAVGSSWEGLEGLGHIEDYRSAFR